MWVRATLCASMLAGVLICSAASDAGAAPLAAITEFGIPTGAAQPDGVASGPDGSVWFTENKTAKIGRITAAGEVSEFALPAAEGKLEDTPIGITTGADGSLWFTQYGNNKVGRITTAGVISEFEVPTAESGPFRITLGPDGNVWFVEEKANKIGRIAPSGLISEFTIPTPGSGPSGIAAGSDGNLWFTESSADKIGRISPSGTFAEFPVPTPSSHAEDITAGPDGNLWFTEHKANKIGRITPAGVVSEFEVPTPNSGPEWITPGADGNLWFTESESNKVARLTPGGPIWEFELLREKSEPEGITTGADGNLWLAEFHADRIGRIGAGAPEALASAPAIAGGGQQGSAQTCGVGWSSWASLQPQTDLLGFDGYRWLLDGAAIASGPSYTPTVANIGHQLACAATVTYPLPFFVTAIATSAPLTVTAPPTPVINGARQSAKTWREGRALATISRARRRHRAPVGTKFSFGLNVQASVTLTFMQAREGRRSSRGCVPRTRRNAKRRRCTRSVTVGRMSFFGHAGLNAVAFQGRVSAMSKLPKGHYTVVIGATNTAGVAAAPVALRFAIV